MFKLQNNINNELFLKLIKCLNDDSIDICFINEVIDEFRKFIN